MAENLQCLRSLVIDGNTSHLKGIREIEEMKMGKGIDLKMKIQKGMAVMEMGLDADTIPLGHMKVQEEQEEEGQNYNQGDDYQ